MNYTTGQKVKITAGGRKSQIGTLVTDMGLATEGEHWWSVCFPDVATADKALAYRVTEFCATEEAQ